MEDRDDLMARATSGDEEAWRELVGRYQRLVFATIRTFRIDADDAEDVFQEAFIRLHRHAGRLRDSQALARWLIVTTRRLSLDCLSRRRTATRLEGADEIPADDPADDELLVVERAHRVREALSDLSPRCRDLLHLLYFEQERPDYRQAASRFGMPIGSVGPTRARCLEQLLKRLQSKDSLDAEVS
jgi:RNA polymerase sigma factor (sigma-70 family)